MTPTHARSVARDLRGEPSDDEMPSADGLSSRDWLVLAGVLAAAFLALASLVANGYLDSVDSLAVHHLMPFGSGIVGGSSSLLSTAMAYPDTGFHAGRLLRLPASFLPSCVLMIVVALVLIRRGRPALGVLWLVAYAFASLAELAGKYLVVKPPLFIVVPGLLLPTGFGHTFPSGHAARATILAAAVLCVWPRLAPFLLLWVGAVIVSAELDAIHTPSDLLGGVLLGAALVCAVMAARPWEAKLERHGSRLLRRISSHGSRSAGLI